MKNSKYKEQRTKTQVSQYNPQLSGYFTKADDGVEVRGSCWKSEWTVQGAGKKQRHCPCIF